jgi:glycolate oxidase FAD binding subunit
LWRHAAAGVVPRRVVEPSTVDELIDLVQQARRAGEAIVPCGNASQLDLGWPPTRYDLALSTRGLARIIAHDAADMTVTVDAGVTLTDLDRTLAPAGQWLPLDPARGDSRTIGGVIAADRCGPRRLAAGKVRDLLIGLRVVLADGALVRGGGRVVKNVAGYDLPKLFAGSHGTLGVIVEATFKIQPRPEGEAVFVWPQPSAAAAVTAALALLDADVMPVCLEAVNGAAAESLGLGDDSALVVVCAGSSEHLAEQERRLDARSRGAAQRLERDHGAALLKALRDFPQPANDEALVARVSARPSDLALLARQLEAAAEARGAVAEIAAHAGSGVAWCQLMSGRDPDARRALAEQLRSAARERGAWVVFETLPATLHGRMDPWGFDMPSVQLMRGIKHALDPDNRFSPGRFVGGI